MEIRMKITGNLRVRILGKADGARAGIRNMSFRKIHAEGIESTGKRSRLRQEPRGSRAP